MEEKEIKQVYFIYTQNGGNNNIKSIELNDNIIDCKELSKEIKEEYIQIIYCLKISKNKDENEIKISLIDNQNDSYNSSFSLIPSGLLEKENITLDDYIIFNLKFKSINDNKGKNLNQFSLAYDTQFYIFESQFKNEDKMLFGLYISTIYQVLLKYKQKFDFILKFFLEIYNNKKIPIIKCFFNNMKTILKNCEYVEHLEIAEEKLNVLNDAKKIRENLLANDEEKNLEEDIYIFLAYYYIHYKKKLFIKFINNKKYENKINISLKSNRNIFNNFTTKIINAELMDYAESGVELLSLMKLYPNIVECFKILTSFNIYLKFINFKQLERRAIGIMSIQEPNINDDINLLKEYFQNIIEYFKLETMFPLIIKEDFFIQYLKLYEENDNDFQKMIIIINMLNLYNLCNAIKFNIGQIFDNFINKGISLLKENKLKNLDFFNFIESAPTILFENEEFINNFHNGIEFNGINNEFVNQILNDDKYNLKINLGNSYYKIIQKIFDKLLAMKDLLVLRDWDIYENTDENLIEIFLKTIERIWINDPENNAFGLENLFAKEFAAASIKMKNYKSILDSIEEKISKEKIMAIYSNILIQEYKASNNFITHIKDYITNYDKITPRYIWFLTTTVKGKDLKAERLRKYLENDGKKFEVKYSDFALYPNNKVETIILFTNLKNYGIIPQYFKDSEYYKNSMRAKYDIEQNIFKDALVMLSNIEKIQELLEYCFTEKNEDDINKNMMLIINFQDKIEATKKYYDSLKLIGNYWETFFQKEKNDELNKLNKFINDFENKKLEMCFEEINLENPLLKYLNEAEEGKKLQGSIIFMEFYKSLNNINNERERFDLALKKFNELKKLGINSNLNSNIFENEIKEGVINAVKKNKDLLDEELTFIKNYFKFGENDNFDIAVIKDCIINLIDN